jgi:hypothetical protein
MADTKLADLTALTTPSGDDILYVVDDPAGTPLDKKLALDNLFTRGTVNGTLLNMSQTWGGTGTYTGIKYDVTDSGPSNAASLLMDLQVGGASRVAARKNSQILLGGAAGTSSFTDGIYASNWLSLGGTSTNTVAQLRAGAFIVSSDVALGWATTTSFSSADLSLTRRAAANLRFGAADAAGSAISVSSVATNQLTLASNHGLSNGAAVQITFTAGGAVPAGTAVNTTYYARSISAAVLELYGTYDQAITTASTTGRVAVTTAGTTAFVNRATPFQTLSVQSFTGTDIPGQPFVITGSQGTGTGAGGSIIFQVAPAGSSGTAQNALATALTIASDVIVNTAQNRFFYVNDRSGNNTGLWVKGSTGEIGLSSGGGLFWSNSATNSFGAIDLSLVRDAANTLALRNGANNQELRVYGSYTSAAVYDRLTLKSSSTVATVAAETDAGDMDLALTPAGTGNVQFGTHAAIVAETVTGYITIKDAGGTLRKIAVVS